MSGAGGLVVVLPELAPDAATHYAHYPALLREVSALAPAVVVVEKGGAAPLAGVEVVAQRHTNPLARAIELARILVALCRRGYRAAYGSYSPYFGVVGSLVGRMVGMRVAFWHCRSDFFDRTISAGRGPRELLLDTLPFVAALHLAHVVITGTEGLARRYAK